MSKGPTVRTEGTKSAKPYELPRLIPGFLSRRRNGWEWVRMEWNGVTETRNKQVQVELGEGNRESQAVLESRPPPFG